MKNYFKEVKSFYDFVSSNFTYYKKRQIKTKTNTKTPENELGTRINAKAKSKAQKRKKKITPTRKPS